MNSRKMLALAACRQNGTWPAIAALQARCHSKIPTALAGMNCTSKNCRSWSGFVIPMHESTKARYRSQQSSLLQRDAHAIDRTRSAKSVRSSVRSLARFSYLLSGAVGGGLGDAFGGALGVTGGIEVFSTGISRQSIAYTKSPFAVLPSADTPPDSEHCSLAAHRQDSEFEQRLAR